MTLTILLTGFGPFPGAPFNPTEVLAQELARWRHPAFANVRRLAHVFTVSYDAIDRDLPVLLEGERPDALIMFGLAVRTRYVRIETRARNALTRMLPDVEGHLPLTGTILAGGPPALPLRTPAQRLLVAARSTGLPVEISHDAGHYLCNYLCWRAAEAARKGMPRITSFIHVPSVRRAPPHPPGGLSLDDLADAGAAIMRAVITSTRAFAHSRFTAR
jgi:pyroglutamyl-peptidase